MYIIYNVNRNNLFYIYIERGIENCERVCERGTEGGENNRQKQTTKNDRQLQEEKEK